MPPVVTNVLRTKDGDAREGQQVQAAREQHDPDGKEPSGRHNELAAGPPHDQRGRHQRERVIHVISDAGFEHREHVWRETRAQRVPHVKLGKYVRFRATELEAWVDGRTVGPRRSKR